MCELFGLSCNEEDRATRSLPVFARYSRTNDDGWGIAYYRGNRAIIKKKPEMAETSPDFHKVVNEARSNVIVAHIRYATIGDICENNCHPFKQHFQNNDWVFAHNGHVDGIERHLRSHGETDSEQVFNFLLDSIESYQSTGRIRGTYPGLVNGVKNVFERYGRGVDLNFMLSDGNILYAFNHYPGKPLYLLSRGKDGGEALLVSTQKLSNENWKKLPSNKLLLANRGQILVLSDEI